MNLLRWQTWNGSSWGVASMENSTWMLWQGGNEAFFHHQPSIGFVTIWQYIKALGSTTPLQWKRHYALTPPRYESLSSENWKIHKKKKQCGKTSRRIEGSWTGRHFHGCHCRGETDQDRYLPQSSSSTFQHPVFVYQKKNPDSRLLRIGHVPLSTRRESNGEEKVEKKGKETRQRENVWQKHGIDYTSMKRWITFGAVQNRK